MPSRSERNAYVYLIIEDILQQQMLLILLLVQVLLSETSKKRKRNNLSEPYRMLERIPNQVKHLHRIMTATDTDCIVNLRMDRNTFGRLCLLLRNVGGLSDGKYVRVEEQVAMFLGILAHHKKNRIVRFDFWRSGQTVHHYLHLVLNAILKLHNVFLVNPKHVPDDETDLRWKWFKGCLGALDGTYINVMVPTLDKPKYRNRKGQIATNLLAVCDRNLQFVYVLAGWEGSAADGRVLRDALNRANGLKVPKGNYYLCDNGYANSEGFLTPYKGVRYHLKEWGPQAIQPQNPQEMFNMRHTKARNIIERAFGIMKMRWGILRSATYYPVKVQTRLIMASFLLHNYIRSQMAVDPIEAEFDATGAEEEEAHDLGNIHLGNIDQIESSAAWNGKRDEIAREMWAAAEGRL